MPASQGICGTSLAVQWLRLHTSTAGGAGLISGWGTKILHAMWQINQSSNVWILLRLVPGQSPLLAQWLNIDLRRPNSASHKWPGPRRTAAPGMRAARTLRSRNPAGSSYPSEHTEKTRRAIFLNQASWLRAFQGTAISLLAQVPLELMTREGLPTARAQLRRGEVLGNTVPSSSWNWPEGPTSSPAREKRWCQNEIRLSHKCRPRSPANIETKSILLLSLEE